MGKKYKIKIMMFHLICLISMSSYAQPKLSVHGHLNQAFAIADKHTIFGIPEEGTFDYRTLALQFRYDINESNSTIIQFSHRRIGLSPLMELESDVKLDWAFFEHKFNHNIGLKIGKILIPFGLHNEIRDVGVLNPFYRVSFVPYSMGSYLSETVNGISAFYAFNYYETNQIEIDFYAGSWQWAAWFHTLYPSPKGYITIVDRTNVKDGLGGRILTNLPVDGIDFVLSWQRGRLGGSLFYGRKHGGVRSQTYNVINLSIDANFGRFYFKPEYVKFFLYPGKFYIHGFSGQMGYEIFDNFILNVSTELINLTDVPRYENENSNIITQRRATDYLRDYAISVNYKFNSNLVFKVETHINKSVAIEETFIDGFKGKPVQTRYLIISVSTSF